MNQSHDNMNQSHDNMNQSYDNMNQSYDNMNQSHDNMNQSYDMNQSHNMNQPHDNMNQSHDNMNQSHDNMNQSHDNMNHLQYLKAESCEVSRSLLPQIPYVLCSHEGKVVLGSEGCIRPVAVPKRVILGGHRLRNGETDKTINRNLLQHFYDL